MKTTRVHCKGAAAPAAAGHQNKNPGSTIKLGVDIHTRLYVVAAQHEHAALKPPRRIEPAELLPWVEALLRAGHKVHVVYEACGFGFGLYRQLVAAGAQCLVIAPRKLDEARKGVKTDALDATTLCQRLSRYLEGNTKELAVSVQEAQGTTDPERVPETFTADKGYFALEEIGRLQELTLKTVSSDPRRAQRRLDKLSSDQRKALARAPRSVSSKYGKGLLRKRGQHIERSFAHVLDAGGMRRTTLRGLENLNKRQQLAAACYNLSQLLRWL